jgi:hypothetical protein
MKQLRQTEADTPYAQRQGNRKERKP